MWVKGFHGGVSTLSSATQHNLSSLLKVDRRPTILSSELSWFSFQPVRQHEHILISSPLQDSELTELKDTIDILKAKNTEAQEIIQGTLSNPEITPKGTEYAANAQYDEDCCPSQKLSLPIFNILSFPLVFRNADQSPELLRKHLQPHQHHQPLQYGQPQRAGGQEEEEEELGTDTPIRNSVGGVRVL